MRNGSGIETVRFNEKKNLFEVLSKSEPGKWHNVDLEQGKCDCVGFSFRGSCHHLREAKVFSEATKITQEKIVRDDGLPF